jgi:hypothetical protein
MHVDLPAVSGRNRRFSLRGILFSLGVILIAIAFWRPWEKTEPVFEGRKASAWLRQYDAAAAYDERDRDWGDRYEAVLAFKGMESNGVAYLAEEALQAEKPTWADRVEILPVNWRSRWEKWLSFNRPRRQRSNPAAYVVEELKPRTDWLLPLLINELKTTNSSDKATALSLLKFTTGHPEALTPHLLSALKDSDDSVRFEAFWAFQEAGPLTAKASVPALIKELQNRRGNRSSMIAALELIVMLGDDARETEPFLESLRTNAQTHTSFAATTALFRMNPKRTELLDVMIDAASSSNASQIVPGLYSLRHVGTNGYAAIPQLEKLAVGPLLKTRQNKLVIWALEDISKESAIKALETRIGPLGSTMEPADWLWACGELLRIAPENLETMTALRSYYKTGGLNAAWRKYLVQSLMPDRYERKPSQGVLLFLDEIAKQDDEHEVRRTAEQALKYFRLKWNAEILSEPQR